MATASFPPKRHRKRLRSRIIIAFVLFGTGLSVLFGIAAVQLRALLEDRLIGRTLEREVESYAAAFRQDPSRPGIAFSKIQGFVYSQRRFGNVPEAWRDLPNGVHRLVESRPEGRVAYQLAVEKDPDVWFFLRYDVTEEERTRGLAVSAFIAVAAFFSIGSLLAGFYFAERVMSPVSELARKIARLGRGARPSEPLSPGFADDEVGMLAQALDDYAERLRALVERDREFNNDVSHELRTPLAVIQSTTELLLAMPDVSDRAKARIERIDRAARQSTELITALLHLSRGERQAPNEGETTAVEQLIHGIVDMHRPTLRGRPVTVQIAVLGALPVPAPAAVISVVLGNLIGNAFKYTREGIVQVVVGQGRVTVDDSGPGIAAADLERVFERHYRATKEGGGAGLGLAIVLRLCELYGWRVALTPREPHGVSAVLDFGASVALAEPAPEPGVDTAAAG